jgi:hypothetical protein
MCEHTYTLAIEDERIVVEKLSTGRRKSIAVTNPHRIIERIGSPVQARSHVEILRCIHALENDEVAQDIALADFAEISDRPKKMVSMLCVDGVLPGPHILRAWMNHERIGEFDRRRILWCLLSMRTQTIDEWNKLVIEFEDIFADHKKFLKGPFE